MARKTLRRLNEDIRTLSLCQDTQRTPTDSGLPQKPLRNCIEELMNYETKVIVDEARRKLQALGFRVSVVDYGARFGMFVRRLRKEEALCSCGKFNYLSRYDAMAAAVEILQRDLDKPASQTTPVGLYPIPCYKEKGAWHLTTQRPTGTAKKAFRLDEKPAPLLDGETPREARLRCIRLLERDFRERKISTVPPEQSAAK